MKTLSKVNSFVKKYQPLIQTLGILLIVVGVVLTFFQLFQARREFEFNLQGRSNDSSPGWRVEFFKSEENALIDELSVSSTNQSYNIQSIQFHIYDGIKEYIFENIGANIATGNIKTRLANIYKQHYNLQTLNRFGCYEEDTYPIAITIGFERYGQPRDTTILYDYHFKTYFSRESIKLMSKGLEFVKYVSKDSATLAKEVITYNLSSSFLSNISDAAFQIKLAMARRDPLLGPAIEYAYLNVALYKNSVVFVTEGTSKRIGEFVLMLPQSLYDSSIREERHKVVAAINERIDDYDEAIVSAILEIQEFEKTFRKVDGKSHIDSLINKGTAVANRDQWDKWARMNSELTNLITKRVKIND